MTPEELAAIRADYWDVDMRLRALCEALTAAWAEAEDWRHWGQSWHDHGRQMAANEYNATGRAERAEAALARVRDLCNEPMSGKTADWLAQEIRAALEGDNQ